MCSVQSPLGDSQQPHGCSRSVPSAASAGCLPCALFLVFSFASSTEKAWLERAAGFSRLAQDEAILLRALSQKRVLKFKPRGAGLPSSPLGEELPSPFLTVLSRSVSWQARTTMIFFPLIFFFFSFLFPPSFPLRSPGSFRPALKSFPTVQRALETRAQRGGEGGRGAQLRGQRDAACGHAVGGRGESPHLPGPGRSGQVYGELQARPLPARSATPGKKAGKTRACRVLSVAARLAAAQPRDVQLMDPTPAAPRTLGIHPAPWGRPPTGPGPPPGEHPGQKGDVKTLWGQLWGGRKAPQGMLSTTGGGGSALWVGKLRQRGAAWSRRGHC